MTGIGADAEVEFFGYQCNFSVLNSGRYLVFLFGILDDTWFECETESHCNVKLFCPVSVWALADKGFCLLILVWCHSVTLLPIKKSLYLPNGSPLYIWIISHMDNSCIHPFPGYRTKEKPPIWDYYKQHTDSGFATCTLCEKIITVKKRYGTGPLFSHLKQHPEEYEKAVVEKQKWQESRALASQLQCKKLGIFFS